MVYLFDSNDMVELCKNVKPDLLYCEENGNFIQYAVLLAGKFLKISVMGGYIQIMPSRNLSLDLY